MIKFTRLNLFLFVGMLCFAYGQTFEIFTEFKDGTLIFRWTNVSTIRNDIVITKDSQSSAWISVNDDQFIVEDVMQYKSVKIQVREYKGQGYIEGHTDYIKTYNVNKIESVEGDSRNLSWTIDSFPASGIYGIFHSARNGLYSIIIHINGGRTIQTLKYVYHSRPINSTDIMFEVRNITLADAGHYVGGITKSFALSEGKDAVLVVNGKPTKPVIKGSNIINVNTKAILECESKSTSAPYYYKFPPLSYSWFVNNTKIYREVRETYSFIVTKDVKYNRYSCQAKEILVSERSEEIRINPLYGPESLKITPNQQNDDLSIFDGETFGPYTCSADCNPPCTAQWKYKHPEGGFRDATPNGTTTVTLPVQTANRTSMVLIRCVVTGIEGRKTSDITLNIYFDHHLDESTLVKTNYYTIIGPDVTIAVNLPVLANPLTSTSGIVWSGPTFEPTSIKISQRDNHFYKHWINSTIPVPDQRSLGNYTLYYKGKVIVDININNPDKPQPPLNFTGFYYNSKYINFTWVANFNGGAEQFFTLTLKHGSSWINITSLADPGEGNIGYYDLGPLSPGHEYSYRLESCNVIGCSKRPAEEKVTFQDGNKFTISAPSMQNIIIVVGVLAGVSVLLLTNFGVYKFARHRAIISNSFNQQQSTHDLKSMTKEYDDVDDVTRKAQGPSLPPQTYEDLAENTEQNLTDYQNNSGHENNQYEELWPDQDRHYSPLKVE